MANFNNVERYFNNNTTPPSPVNENRALISSGNWPVRHGWMGTSRACNIRFSRSQDGPTGAMGLTCRYHADCGAFRFA